MATVGASAVPRLRNRVLPGLAASADRLQFSFATFVAGIIALTIGITEMDKSVSPQ